MSAEQEAIQIDRKARDVVGVASFNSDRIADRVKQIEAGNRAFAAKGGGSTTDASVMAVSDENIRSATMDQLLEMVTAQNSAKEIRYDADQVRSSGVVQYATTMAESGASLARGISTIADGASNWDGWSRFRGGSNGVMRNTRGTRAGF